MQLAKKLKEEGNKNFLSGDNDKAAAAYLQAIEVLTVKNENNDEGNDNNVESEINDKNSLLAVLYSNLSNVFQFQGDYEKSWQAAEQATMYNPSFVKAWLRYVHNRRLAGYPFEAFVALLRYLRPLLRTAVPYGSTPATVDGDISTVEILLYEDLGLSRVLPHIELEGYEGGGVGIIARKLIKPEEIILVEKRFDALFTDMNFGTRTDLTTEKMVLYFAEKILPHQLAKSEIWEHSKRQFKGCWPRRPEDIFFNMREKIAHELRVKFSSLSKADFEELLAFSLMCRYNCFWDGFFRACALANHSCYANAAMKFNPANSTVTLIAVRRINAGEFINVKYISDAQFIMGVGNRREFLFSWLFWCTCTRCLMDNQIGATQEKVECCHCHKYTHLPLVQNKTGLGEEDPLLTREKPCTYCGQIVTWSSESRTTVAQLMTSFNIVTSYTTYNAIITWLLDGLRQVGRLRVHPENWLYRTLFYFFCIPMKSIIDEAFKQFCLMGWSSSVVETLLRDSGVRCLYKEMLARAVVNGEQEQHFLSSQTEQGLISRSLDTNISCYNLDHDHNESNNKDIDSYINKGGDVLYIFCVLWNLISSFYPENEGWAVHRAICHLALFSYTNPNESAALSGLQTLKLLRRHGKWIGDTEISLWLLAYNRFKPTNRHNGLLSSKQIKNSFYAQK